MAQTGVLHNTIAERVDADPFSSGYLDDAYDSRACRVPGIWMKRESHAGGFTKFRASDNYISIPHFKTLLGKISRQIQYEPVSF